MALTIHAPDPAARLPISVVLALPDHRGQAARAVESWLRQTSPPCEVIVVTPPGDPAARHLPLRAVDRLVTYASHNVNLLTDVGARLARGRLLLLTESHVIAQEDCLAEVARYVDQTGCDAACVASDGIDVNRLGELEEQVFQQDFVHRAAPGHWNKVTIRGLAIRREVYLASGGFEHRYGHFSELLLGVRLHEAGYQVGHAQRAVVGHYNNTSLEALAEGILDFARGWARFAAEHPHDPRSKYFGRCRAWESVDAWNRLRQSSSGGWRQWWTDLRRTVWSPRWRLARAALARRWAALRIRLWQRFPERMLRAYSDFWQATIAYGQADYFVRPHAKIQPEVTFGCRAA